MSNSIDREIKSLAFGAAVRKKRGMYLSADDLEALYLGLREIYQNSLDALMETGAKNGLITIRIRSKERTAKVIDNGPGIISRVNEQGVNTVVAAMTESHTGSHTENTSRLGAGTNGIGASCVSHTSEWFKAENVNNGEYTMAFFRGSDQGAQMELFDSQKSKAPSGLTIEYVPDKNIYHDAWFVEEELLHSFHELMKFYPSIKLILDFDGSVTTIHYPQGLKTKNTQLYYESDNLILALNLGDGEVKPFGNRLYMSEGNKTKFFSHFKAQLTRIVNDLSGLGLSGPQILNMFEGYIAVFVEEPLFSNQSKSAISNAEVNTEISMAMRQEFDKFSQTSEWEKFVKALEMELKAEEAAERARNKIKNALAEIDKGAKSKAITLTEFKDCINHGPDSWLFICEGKSAAGSLALGRGPKEKEYIALTSIRGKIINCLKNNPDKFLDNEEVKALGKILGCGFFEKYNAKKLRFGKVGICVDADEDGKSIMNLLTVFFYICMPELIKEGRLYWIRMPLYSKDGKHFIYTEEDWKSVKNKKGYTRNKGLGEMDGEEMALAAYGEERRWEQLKVKNWTQFSELIEELMGKDISARRDRLMTKVDFERIKFL